METTTHLRPTSLEVLSVKKLSKPFWILNWPLLWGALLGWLFSTSIIGIGDTARHRGPGVLFYEDDRAKKARETEYKRSEYVKYGSLALFAAGFWVMAAWAEDRERVQRLAYKQYLSALIAKVTAYHNAFYSALDEQTRTRAAQEALQSPEYITAEAAAQQAHSVHLRAKNKD